MGISEWVPITQELQARGVTDPVVIVGVLTCYDLPLASGRRILGRFQEAVSTVASVMSQDRRKIETEYVERSATPEAASAFIEELKALAPKLEGLPGVVGTPRFNSVEPRQLAIYTRNFATQQGIPIPTTSRASTTWVPLLQELRARGYDDPDVAQFVLNQTRLRLKSGLVVEPLDEDARYLTVAAAYGLEPAKFRQQFFLRMMQVSPGGRNPVAKSKEARVVLRSFPEVEGVDELPPTRPPPPVQQYREGDELIAPPWVTFPEPPSSLRWRMGPGEDYMDRWLPFWRGLPDGVRRDYLSRYPPPAAWREWLGIVEH